MRRAYLVRAGRRGVLTGLVSGAFWVGLLALRWTVVACLVVLALWVLLLVRASRWTIGRMRGTGPRRWEKCADGYWRPCPH